MNNESIWPWRNRITSKLISMVVCFVGVTLPNAVLAWGATGHRLIGEAALSSLPPEVPAFLREPESVAEMGELAREPDRWKGSGAAHDLERDGAHFLDLDDDGKVLGGPVLASLPPTREGYEAALRSIGSDSWRAGWLPYSIIDGYQQLAKDFAYLRVDLWAAEKVADVKHRAWFAADARERRALILRDVGTLAHYVGDGSQPLHVSIHYNGWGSGPNPEGFTQAKVHAPFEGQFVHDNLTLAEVMADVSPFADCRCDITQRVPDYLKTTNAQVAPFYRLEKAGAFVGSDKRGIEFAATRLAAGASELRDLIVLAWRASPEVPVGYPPIKPTSVVNGRFDPYDSLYGKD